MSLYITSTLIEILKRQFFRVSLWNFCVIARYIRPYKDNEHVTVAVEMYTLMMHFTLYDVSGSSRNNPNGSDNILENIGNSCFLKQWYMLSVSCRVIDR